MRISAYYTKFRQMSLSFANIAPFSESTNYRQRFYKTDRQKIFIRGFDRNTRLRILYFLQSYLCDKAVE